MSASSAKSATPAEFERVWLLLDGTDMVLGRMATKIATVLMGKHKPTYQPHIDTGDFIVLINAEKVRVSPKEKPRKRFLHRHSGYLGNQHLDPLVETFEENPARVIEQAVKKMLPKNSLARHMFSKLRIYVGAAHPHVAQQPQPFPTWI
jgi:large subunit ribosomal protein L13